MELAPRDLTRKERGAFFTPAPIAEFLASWAIKDKRDARVLDPTCGEAVFLLSAASHLRDLGAQGSLHDQLFGVDLHRESLETAAKFLADEQGAAATLLESDFSLLETSAQLDPRLPKIFELQGENLPPPGP